MIELTTYTENHFVLPCVVDIINFEKQVVLDVIQHKDQMIKKGDEVSYLGNTFIIDKKLRDFPIRTEVNVTDRMNIRKTRYYCIKKQ